MGLPRLSYGTKTIDFPTPQRSLQIEVGPPRTVQMTVTGATEILTMPRVDIRVTAEWLIDSASLRLSIENWAQAAQRGEAWTLALDSAKVVDTTIVVDALAGESALFVNDASGITVGQTYRLIDGPNYQLVSIASLSADLVTVNETLDFDVGVGAILRDQFYFKGVLRDDRQASPLRILELNEGHIAWPPTRFIFAPEFYDSIAIAEESLMIFKALSANATGSDVATAQPWFPSAGGVQVAANTLYFFDGYLRTSRSAGTVSHTTSLLFGGTATLSSIAYKAQVKTGDAASDAVENATLIEVATATVVKQASSPPSATEQIGIRVTGIVRVNAAGTLIPQFQYSAAPGGAPSILANSYFRLWPEGAGSATSRGTWS